MKTDINQSRRGSRGGEIGEFSPTPPPFSEPFSDFSDWGGENSSPISAPAVIKKDIEITLVSAEIDSQSQFLPSSISVCIFSFQNMIGQAQK